MTVGIFIVNISILLYLLYGIVHPNIMMMIETRWHFLIKAWFIISHDYQSIDRRFQAMPLKSTPQY